jgi:hypothetical protein
MTIGLYRIFVVFIIWVCLNPLINIGILTLTIRSIEKGNIEELFLAAAALVLLMVLPIINLLKGMENRRISGITKVFFTVYYFILSSFMAVIYWTFFISNPAYFIIVFTTSIFAAICAGKNAISKSPFLLIFLLLLIMSFWVKYLIFIPLVLVLLIRSMPYISLRSVPITIFISVSMILSACWICYLTSHSDSAALKEILKTDGIQPVITAEKNKAMNMLSDSFRYAVEDCSGKLYIIGARSSDRRGYDLATTEKNSPERIHGLLKRTPSSDRPATDCDGGLFFAGDYKTGKIHVFSVHTFDEISVFDPGLKPLTNISIDVNRKFLILGSDKVNEIVRISYSKFPRVEKKRFRVQSSDFLLSDSRLIVAGLSSLEAINIDTGKILSKHIFGIPDPENRISLDTVHEKIVGTNFICGFITVYDSRTLSPLRRKWLSPGIRFIYFDIRRDLIYVANYLSGKIYILDGSSLKTRKLFFTGRRIRNLAMSANGEELIVVSSAGLFKIKIDRVLSNK